MLNKQQQQGDGYHPETKQSSTRHPFTSRLVNARFDSAQLTQVERRQKERVAMNFYVAYNFIKANKDDNKMSSFISSMTEIF